MHLHPERLSRRRLLHLGVGLGAAIPLASLAACVSTTPSPSRLRESARASASPSEAQSPDPTIALTPQPTPTPPPPPGGRILFGNGALADGRAERLQVGVSILVDAGRIVWIRPVGGEEDPGNARFVDAAGATFVPGMVDCHAHVTGPGGANWIERFNDTPEQILGVAEENGAIATQAGIRWLRDVGSPRATDPIDGRVRGLALGIRDRWLGRIDRPYLRAAGSWIFRSGTLSMREAVEAQNGDQLLAAAMGQLDDGANLVKLYMDGPDAGVSPWTANEVARVVTAAHARGAKVTAHGGALAGTAQAVLGGVDSVEHGFELDAATAAEMAARGTFLVSTLSVFRSWLSFGSTTTIPGFAGANGLRSTQARLETAQASLRTAAQAGVQICAGTDFGGGSLRANQLAWEIESQVEAGVAPAQALAAATWRGGELLGEPEAGVITEGGPADFFLVHGDPLSDPSALWRVWRRAWDPVQA